MTTPTESTRPAPGTRLSFRWRKWDGSAHWVHECVYLGSDRWGDWVGQLTGWLSARPGRRMRAPGDSVTLLPPSGEYASTFNTAHPSVSIYIDVAWDVGWDPATGDPVGIDMDLDVVKSRDARGVWIDDRDEWDDHRVALGYPLDIVERLERVAVDLAQQVRSAAAPYDGATAAGWLARLAALPGEEAGMGEPSRGPHDVGSNGE